MNWENHDGAVAVNCSVFFKVKEAFGGLSNMSNDYPLMVNGVKAGSSEALYQACRYPHRPEWQAEIMRANLPMIAKRIARKKEWIAETRSDWEEIRASVMRWALQVKLAQHPRRMRAIFEKSRRMPIVERSSKDSFWGAILEDDGVLRGENRLGILLMELRNMASPIRVIPPAIEEFKIGGDFVSEIRERSLAQQMMPFSA